MYEEGEDLEEDELAVNAANLPKTLQTLPGDSVNSVPACTKEHFCVIPFSKTYRAIGNYIWSNSLYNELKPWLSFEPQDEGLLLHCIAPMLSP